MNYPNGVTSGDIDNLCQTDNSTPNRHDCIGCHREIEQDDDTRWWFFSDEFPYTKPTHRCDFTVPFETEEGVWCNEGCYNELAINADEPKLFLVGGAR